jgi:hypothetical protein
VQEVVSSNLAGPTIGRWGGLAGLESGAALGDDAVLGELGDEGGGALDVAGDDQESEALCPGAG